MIYLIGGVLKSGKTYLARKIMEEKKIPFFETDFLNYALSNEGLFNYNDDDQIVAKYLEPKIERIIDFLIKYEGDYVIEGAHITPTLISKLKDKYSKLVKPVILGYPNSNKDDKYDDIVKNDDPNESSWYKTLKEEDFKELLNKKIDLSKNLQNVCIKNEIKFFDVRNIVDSYKEIIAYLFN